MIATGVITPFLIPVKVAAMVAFIVVLPYVLYQAWAFVAPGPLRAREEAGAAAGGREHVLFLLGIAFCYFFVFGVVFDFVNKIAPASITVAPDIEQYLNFVLTMFLAFGVTFEVPIVVILLARMGIVTLEQLRSIRPYFIVGAFVIAAVVTPPDVISQLLLAIPMCLLYELGLVRSRASSGSRASRRRRLPPPTDAQMDSELDRIDANEVTP